MTVSKKRVKGRFSAAWLLPLVGLLALSSLATAASSTGEEALRSRAEECYNALQQGNWKKAEKYLTKDSRELFRNQDKHPLGPYQIQSVKIEPDGKTASVVVVVPFSSAAVPTPILLPKTTLWHLINHVWYMEILKPEPASRESVFDMAPKGMSRAPGSVYSRDLKFDSAWVSVGRVANNETRVARFPFKNVSTHAVTLADMQLGCDCLRLKTQPTEYKPGESGTLEIEFDPSKLGINFEESFTGDVIFRTEPGGRYVKLTIAALLTGPSQEPPAKP